MRADPHCGATGMADSDIAALPLAYRWRHATLIPIAHVQAVALDELVGIERQKAALLQNVQQFVQGRPANHVLLTGSRGTGKSSLVKALLTRCGWSRCIHTI